MVVYRMNRLIAVLCVASAFVLVLSGRAADGAPAQAALTLQINSAVTHVDTDGTIPISWKLTNNSGKAVTVCTWPGIAFAGGWVLADGSVDGFGPGYPDTPELALFDFRELRPGESIAGDASESAYATSAGYIRYHAYFRSGSDGKSLGLRAWHGEIDSNLIEVQVPKKVPN